MSETMPDDRAAPPETHPEPDRERDTERFRTGMVRVAIWTVAIFTLLAWLAFGSVSAVWYRYSAFTERVIRQDERRGIVEVWSDWMNNLPQAEGEWALGAVFIGAIAVVLVAVIGGCWLLLVSSGDLHPRAARPRHR